MIRRYPQWTRHSPSTTRGNWRMQPGLLPEHVLNQSVTEVSCLSHFRTENRRPLFLKMLLLGRPRRPRQVEGKAGRERIVAERAHRIERELGVALGPDGGHFLEDVGRRRDDVAAHLLGLDHVEYFPRRGPDDLDIAGLAGPGHRVPHRRPVVDA